MADFMSISRKTYFAIQISCFMNHWFLRSGLLGSRQNQLIFIKIAAWRMGSNPDLSSAPAPGHHFISWAPLTYTAWDGVIPLGQGVWHGLAADGRGTLEQVTWVTLKSNYGTCRELEPILLPYLGSGTELHCVSLVRGTAGEVKHREPVCQSDRREDGRRCRRTPMSVSLFVRSKPRGTSVSPFPPMVSLGITTEVSLRCWEMRRISACVGSLTFKRLKLIKN